MKRIYLVDYLGIHCGMDYYLEAFKRVLEDLPDVSVKILSNYSDDDNPPFFKNQYKGRIWNKAISLIINSWRLHYFVKNHEDDVFIFLTYGNAIDRGFLSAVTISDNHVIDIHEAIAQNVDNNKSLKSKLAHIYRGDIRTVISHSGRTDNYLKEFGFKGKTFSVPHFRYVFPKGYDPEKISDDIKQSIDKSRSNVLFFGNLNYSKGVDILLKAINELDEESASKLNFIIAGKDFDGAVNSVAIKSGRDVCIFPRHINDDELRYLYENTDFIILPYRKTSQSGILEMAFYFQKPVILSKLPYFEKMLEEFPSFGILAGTSDKDFAEALRKLPQKDVGVFFQEGDYKRFTNRKEINQFKKDFQDWLRNKS